MRDDSDVALPALVAPAALVRANSRLSASAAAAEVSGFGIAGWLVPALAVPLTILVDALPFLASAASLAMTGARKMRPIAASRSGFQTELRDGVGWLSVVVGLRVTLTSAATIVVVSVNWLLVSPVRVVRWPPVPALAK